MTASELLELACAGLVIAAIALATHLSWPAMVAGAVAAAWFAHSWEWSAKVTWPLRRPKRKGR